MEDVLETTGQCEHAVSDSDSGDSLFLTQPASLAERRVRRRSSSRRPGQSSRPNWTDESKSDEDGEKEKGPDTLPSRDSDSDSTESGLTEIHSVLPFAEPQVRRTCRRPQVFTGAARPKRIQFPFLKSRFGRLTVRKNQILVNAEIGGFFKSVKKLSKGHSKRRKELSPTSNRTLLESDSMDEDNEDYDDIRIVDNAHFIETDQKVNDEAEGLKKEKQKEARKRNDQQSNQPPKGAKGLSERQDGLSESSSPGLKASRPRSRRQETKSRKSARSSTGVSKVTRNLFVDPEECGENEPEILVTSSQSQSIEHPWPSQDGPSGSETLFGGSDDETVVLETQWPVLPRQSQEGYQRGGTEKCKDGHHELLSRLKSGRNRSEAPDRLIDSLMVASPGKINALESRYCTRSLNKRSCHSTPEKKVSLREDTLRNETVSSRESGNLVKSLQDKYGISAEIKIHLVDCLALEADNATKQCEQAEEEPIELCVQKKKEQNVTTDNEERREDVSRSAELEEMQTSPPSSPSKAAVGPPGSCVGIYEETGVGGSTSNESLHSEDGVLDSGRFMSSQDLFEEPNDEADVTVVSSSFIEFITGSDNEDAQESTMQGEESKKENEEIGSKILPIESGRAENSERAPEGHGPELIETSLIQAPSKDQETMAPVAVGLVSLVDCPSGSKARGASSRGNDVIINKQRPEADLDALGSSLFNLDGLKILKRKVKRKTEPSKNQDPTPTHERFMPSYEVSKMKKRKEPRPLSECSASIADEPVPLTVTDLSERQKSGTKGKKGHLCDQSGFGAPESGEERQKETIITDTGPPSETLSESFKGRCDIPSRVEWKPVMGQSLQTGQDTEAQSTAEGGIQAKKKKRKKAKEKDQVMSGYGSTESNTDANEQEVIITARRPSFGSFAGSFRANCDIPLGTEIQPVMCPALQAGQDSEAQSTDDRGAKAKKKKKKDKRKESSSPVRRTGQAEDPSQESCKDLIPSDSSEPVKKRKKAKKKDIPDDTVTQDQAEQYKSGDGTIEKQEETTSEDLVSMADGFPQLTQSGRFSPQYSSTQVPIEARADLVPSDCFEPVKKKKKAKKKDSPDDMVLSFYGEQSKSRSGTIETNLGEDQVEEITPATGSPSETHSVPLKANSDILPSTEIKPVMCQSPQAGPDSEGQSTADCGAKAKKKKKKHKKSSLPTRRGQDENPQMPSPSSEAVVRLTRADIESQWDMSTEIQSQETSKDLRPSDGAERVKKRKKAKDTKDHMITVQCAEEPNGANGTTDENQAEASPKTALQSGQDSEAQSTDNCGIKLKKKKKKDKHKELSLIPGQDGDSQMPSQMSDVSDPVKKKKKKKAKEKDNPHDVLTLQSADQVMSGYGSTESNTDANKQDMIIMCPALQAGQDSEAQSTDDRGAKVKKRKKKDKRKESPSPIRMTGQAEDLQMPRQKSCKYVVSSDSSEPVQKKKKRKKEKEKDLGHAERSKSGDGTTETYDGERQKEEMPSENLVSMADGFPQLSPSGLFSPQYSSTQVPIEVSEYIHLSDGSEPVKRKKAKKKDQSSPGNMVRLQSAEYSTTETNSGEVQEARSTDESGVNVKKKKKKHKHKESSEGQDVNPRLPGSSSEGWCSVFSQQDSNPEVCGEPRKDLVPSDSSEPVKKKKRSNEDPVEQGITAGEKQEEEIITASRELTGEHGLQGKKKRKKDKHIQSEAQFGKDVGAEEALLLLDVIDGFPEPSKKKKTAKILHLRGNMGALQDAEEFESGYGSSKSKVGGKRKTRDDQCF